MTKLKRERDAIGRLITLFRKIQKFNPVTDTEDRNCQKEINT